MQCTNCGSTESYENEECRITCAKCGLVLGDNSIVNEPSIVAGPTGGHYVEGCYIDESGTWQ